MDLSKRMSRIRQCLNENLCLKHKYLGLVKVTRIEDDLFYVAADSGEYPFRYDEFEKMFTVVKTRPSDNDADDGKHDTPDERNIPQTYDASLYGKHRRTLFPATDSSESEKRHSQNSKKSLR